MNRMSLVKFSVAILKVLRPLDSYLQPVFYVTLKRRNSALQKEILRIKAWISYTVKNFHKQAETEIKHLKPRLKKENPQTYVLF